MSSAVGDMVNNPAIEGGDGGEDGHSLKKHDIGTLARLLGYGATAARGAYDAGSGTLKYLGNTGLDLIGQGDTNSVPIGRRLMVAAAETPEDKLKTLRQWYPDAMPKDGDFVFYDPIRKKQMTLNDSGLSYGDMANAVPSLGELGGTVLGSIGGGALGGVAGAAAGSALPAIGNTVGGVGGAIAGAGAGGAAGGVMGKEAGSSVAQLLGSLLNGGGQSFDTRTPEQKSSDRFSTAKWDGALSALGPAAQGVKIYAASKFLKPESAALFDAAKAAGYIPSLGQIGSPTGAAVESKLVRQGAGDFAQNAAANENVLNSKVDQFLGDNAGATKNDLANALRSGNKANVSGIKGAASDLYENFPFSDTAIPEANQSKGVVREIYKKMGMQEVPQETGPLSQGVENLQQPASQTAGMMKLSDAPLLNAKYNHNLLLQKMDAGIATEQDVKETANLLGQTLDDLEARIIKGKNVDSVHDIPGAREHAPEYYDLQHRWLDTRNIYKTVYRDENSTLNDFKPNLRDWHVSPLTPEEIKEFTPSADVVKESIPPTSSSSFVLPNGGKINPTYDFDPTINNSLERLAAGKMTEQELSQLDTNIGFYLKKGQAYPQAANLLNDLRSKIRADLVTGAPGTAPEQLQARALWKQAKDTQEGLTSIFGKQEGVTQGVSPLGGMSEGKNLEKGLGVFSNGPAGSDTVASGMSDLLAPQDKKTLLAAILKQPATANMNGVDAAAQKFNMDRVAKYLTNPQDAQQFNDLLSSAKGVLPYSQLPPDTTPLLKGFGDTLLNRTQKWGTNSALNSASQGNVPGSYVFNPSAAQSPLTAGVARALPSINHANQSIPSYMVSPQAMESGLPDSQKTTGVSPKVDLEALLAKDQKFSVNLEDYLKDQPAGQGSGPSVTDYAGTPMTNKLFQKPDGTTPQGPPSELGYQPLDHYRQPATQQDLDNFINQHRPAPESTATQQDLNDFINQSKPPVPSAAPSITTPEDALKTLQSSRRKPVMPIVNEDIPAAGAAFLKRLSSPGNEGAGYHTLVGGKYIEDLSDHPNIVGVRTAQGPSTAFGRYQFINPTWKEQQEKYGYEDMSPANQDLAAWNLAKDTHQRATGNDLAKELASGDADRIAAALRPLAPVWASLPGGVQQGNGANTFIQDLQQDIQDTPATKGDLNDFIAQNKSQPPIPDPNDPLRRDYYNYSSDAFSDA